MADMKMGRSLCWTIGSLETRGVAPMSKNYNKKRDYSQIDVEQKLQSAQSRRFQLLSIRVENCRQHGNKVDYISKYVKTVKKMQLLAKKNLRCKRIAASRFARLSQSALCEMADFFEQHDIDFESMMKHLTETRVIAATKILIHSTCLPHKAKLPTDKAARTFLTCFMINRFPEFVLNDRCKDESETKLKNTLIQASKILEKNFLAVKRLTPQSSTEEVNKAVLKLRHTNDIFTHQFQMWKDKDLRKIAQDLLRMYVLVKAELHKSKSEAALMTEEQRNANPGMAQFIMGQETQLVSLKDKARKIMNSDDFELWMKEANKEGVNSAPDAQNSSETKISVEIPEIKNVKPTNEAIMYELLIDPDFKLDREQIEEKIDILTSDIKSDKESSCTEFLNGLSSFRDRLAALTPNRQDLIEKLNEYIDVSFIRERLEKNTFLNKDFVDLIGFIAERILMLQSPSRNQATTAWVKNLQNQQFDQWLEVVPFVFQFISLELDIIQVDMANFQLRMLNNKLEKEDKISYLKAKLTPRIEILKNSTPAPESPFTNMTEAFHICCFQVLTQHNKRRMTVFDIFDAGRIAKMKSTINTLSKVVTAEIVFCQYASASKQQRKEFRTQVYTMLLDHKMSPMKYIIEAISHLNKEASIERVEKSLDYLEEKESTLFKSIERRFELILKSGKPNFKRSVFAVWESEVQQLWNEYQKFADVHLAVFGEFWESMC